MIRFQLYSTVGCHLCELAVQVLANALQHTGQVAEIEEIDIVDDPALMDLYGIRIPVIRLVGSEQELGWPFQEQDVLDLLKKSGQLLP